MEMIVVGECVPMTYNSCSDMRLDLALHHVSSQLFAMQNLPSTSLFFKTPQNHVLANCPRASAWTAHGTKNHPSSFDICLLCPTVGPKDAKD